MGVCARVTCVYVCVTERNIHAHITLSAARGDVFSLVKQNWLYPARRCKNQDVFRACINRNHAALRARRSQVSACQFLYACISKEHTRETIGKASSSVVRLDWRECVAMCIACVFICMHECLCAYMCVYMHACVPMWMYARLRVCTSVYVAICVSICMFVCAYLHMIAFCKGVILRILEVRTLSLTGGSSTTSTCLHRCGASRVSWCHVVHTDATPCCTHMYQCVCAGDACMMRTMHVHVSCTCLLAYTWCICS
jgi:hypothetical protein